MLNGRSTFKVKCLPYWSGVWERGGCYKGGYTGGHPASSGLGVSKALVILIPQAPWGLIGLSPTDLLWGELWRQISRIILYARTICALPQWFGRPYMQLNITIWDWAATAPLDREYTLHRHICQWLHLNWEAQRSRLLLYTAALLVQSLKIV